MTRVVGDPEQEARTFVLVSEVGEGGWGLAGRTGGPLVEWAMEHVAATTDTATD